MKPRQRKREKPDKAIENRMEHLSNPSENHEGFSLSGPNAQNSVSEVRLGLQSELEEMDGACKGFRFTGHEP